MQVCTSSRSARTSGCSTTNSTVEKEWVRSFWGSTLAAHITKFPNSEKSQIIISGFTICKHQGSFKNIHISFTAGRFGGTACGSARRRRRRWWPSRRWRPKLGFAFTTSSPPGRWFQLISPKVTWLSFYCLLVAQPQMCLGNFWTEIPVYSHMSPLQRWWRSIPSMTSELGSSHACRCPTHSNLFKFHTGLTETNFTNLYQIHLIWSLCKK